MRKYRAVHTMISALCALVLVLGLVPRASAAQTFSDVREGQWFAPFVDKAVEAGLVQGTGNGAFAPNDHLTLGQAAVLAYQIHSRNYSKELPQVSGAWYMPYYQYCLDNDIFTAAQVPLSAINRDATRYEMVAILDKAVPDSQMTAINTLPDGFVPDLAESSAYGDIVYKWYRAGALTGDTDHCFNGDNNITRAEVSVVLCEITNLVERTKLDPVPTAEPKAVTGVAVTIAKTSLTVKDTTTATAVVTPSDAANKTVTWTSSNTKVASVSSSGQITALSAGTAVITATASNGVKGTASVTVTAAAQDAQALIDEVIRLTNVERAKEGLPALETYDALSEAAAIRAPETVTLFSHTRPDGSSCFTALDETGAKTGAYTWGENIAAGNSTAAATVQQWMNSSGHRANILNPNYTHIGVGYATGGQYGCSWVQMFVGRQSTPAAKAVTGVSVSIAKTTLNVKDTTTASAAVTPSDAANKTVTWSSSDTKVASVSSSGQITALSAGTAAITATASNGVKGTAYVTVKEAPAAPTTPTTPTTSQNAQALIDEVIRLTNVERAKEGLPALKTYDALSEAAAIRAPETVTLFSHTRPDGSSCFTALDETGAKTGAYTWGENIAAGNSTAAATVEQWMNSPGHRANILNPDYTHIGVGYATGGQYGHSWVQMFIGRRDDPSSASQSSNTSTTQPSGGTSSPSTSTPSQTTTSSDIPASGLTDYYREDWGNGQYLEVRITNGNTITFSGCVNLSSIYNYAVLWATANRDEVPFTSGVPFTATTTVNLETLRKQFEQKPDSLNGPTLLICQNYKPNSNSAAGVTFQNIKSIYFVLDESGSCTMRIVR